MVILDKRHIDSKVVQKGDMNAWVKEGIIKETDIVKSSVKPSTLNPKWGECYEL